MILFNLKYLLVFIVASTHSFINYQKAHRWEILPAKPNLKRPFPSLHTSKNPKLFCNNRQGHLLFFYIVFKMLLISPICLFKGEDTIPKGNNFKPTETKNKSTFLAKSMKTDLPFWREWKNSNESHAFVTVRNSKLLLLSPIRKY